MAVVKFGAYRRYERDRIDASNAMMALLAGAQLAGHLLKLNEGSPRLLPEVYPNVAHIGRFNLTAGAAGGILASADAHLGAMSVPYLLAIHEDYMTTCLQLLARAGRISSAQARVRAAGQHTTMESCCGTQFDPIALSQLHALRLMRNARIHEGARASRALIQLVSTWDAATEAAWTRLAGRSPRHLSEGDPLEFAHGEMLVGLAVTKNIDRQANMALQTSMPRALWADLVIEDMLESTPNALSRSDRERKARGIARHYYAALALSEAEIRQAISRIPAR
jgi:hypothetical protein